MLIFFNRILFILIYRQFSLFSWPVIILVAFIFYIRALNFRNLRVLSFFQESVLLDSLSLFMTFLLFVVIVVSYLISLSLKSFRLIRFVLFFLCFSCYQVFNSSNIFLLYFFFEASLIPIFYIIIKWGSYPERSSRAIIILVYTLLFGSPVLVLIIYYFIELGSINFVLFSFNHRTFIISLFLFLCFCVKLPIYGLHFWLPIAHVEAPTFGSVILARVLLKLGGVGLVRLSRLLSLTTLKYFLLSYFLVFIIFSSLVCCYQSDFKRLVAYSSVAHIITIPFLVFSSNILSIQSLVMVMYFHGLRSTLLFILVGVLYSFFSSRQLVAIRGLFLVSPLLSLLVVFTFLFSISAPPFPSFIAEVYFFMSCYFITPIFGLVVLIFSFLGLLYNLNWLSSILFCTAVDISFRVRVLSFRRVLSFFISFISILPFCFLFALI